jgi:anti-sigma regulatory factor (Ser/Thr protein kinase)
MTAEPFVLEVSTDALGISTARTFGRSVARALRLDPDETEDLELVTSELCAAFTGRASALRVRIARSSCETTIDVEPTTTNGVEPDIDESRQALLEAVTAGVRWDADAIHAELARSAARIEDP